MEFYARPELHLSSYRMEQRARAVARNQNWQKRILPTAPELLPDAIVKPVAAGAKVVASTRSPVYKFLRENYSDAAAVEMEGFGFLEAIRANLPTDALVIRGISDLIEGKSVTDAEGWQVTASRHAAAFAFEVLGTLYIPSVSPQTESSSSASVPGRTSGHGIAKRVSNLPHRRNPNFTGRVDLIAQLHESLTSSGTSDPVQLVALHGLGGMGKTQIAIEYTYRHAGSMT